MTDYPNLERHFAAGRDTKKLGLEVGHKLGLMDPTTNYVIDNRWDRSRYAALHRSLPVVDGYSAVLDIQECLRGGIDVAIQAFGVEEMYIQEEYIDGKDEPVPGLRFWKPMFEGEDMVKRILMQIEDHKRFAAAYGDYIEVVYSGDDLDRIVGADKIAMVLMLISGFITDSIDVLKQYHAQGVRVMCPSHISATSWADSTTELNDPPGLNGFGRDVIRACNEIGVLVDVAHCSDYTVRDTLAAANKPVIATHTKVRAISGAVRDMSDDLLRGLADSGGAACVLAAAPRSPVERHAARLKRDKGLLANYSDPFERAAAKLNDAQLWGTKLDLATIDHAVNVAGIDHVGLSSHSQSVPQWREFTDDLIEHGYSEQEAGKILGGNALRVLKETIC